MKEVQIPPTLASADKCTGCGACANVCPRNAITLPWNEDGFRAPVVDTDACVGCGACTKICPVLDTETRYSHEPLEQSVVYSGWHTDVAIRRASSSGGVFSALAERIIEQGGVVFGVEQRDDISAGYISVDTVQDLQKLRCSKYVQAEVGTIYRRVRDVLKSGKRALFAGTPCQVAGLISFLRKPHPLLITCDIACHGVPSHHLHRNYINELTTQAGSPISGLNYRDKKVSWLKYGIKVDYERAATQFLDRKNDPYMRMFLSDGCLNLSCYTCNWSHPRRSDITLADYWGVQRAHPEWNTTAGVSIVYVNTVAGQEFLLQCGNSLQLQEENAKGQAIARVSNGGLSLRKMYYPQRRRRIIDDLKTKSLPVVVKSHLCSDGLRLRKDVAIMGMWMSCNYGAVFTSFALYRIIESMGLDPILLDVSATMREQCRDPKTVFRQFIKTEGLQTSPCIGVEQLPEWNDRVDTFLVGSDQVWRHRYMGAKVLAYFLNYAQGLKRHIAYGPSFGTETADYPSERLAEAAACLQCFDGVSSRERQGVDILRNQFGIDATFVLDPVFLHPADKWNISAERAERKPEGSYITTYILDPTPDKRAMLEHISKRLDTPLLNMLDAQVDFEAKKAELGLPNVVENLTLEEWLYNIKNCTHFVTDSFHGLCFALIFNKPFTCIANTRRGFARFTSILELANLMDRLVPEHAPVDALDNMSPIDWDAVNGILDSERERSRQWLHDALFAPRNPLRVQAGLLLNQIYRSCAQLKSEILSDSASSAASPAAQPKVLTSADLQVLRKSHEEQLEGLRLALQYKGLRSRYWRYKILSKITWGKRRRKYKEKRNELRELLRRARRAMK